MKINLTSKMSSRLSMTPQLQNAIKLLQLSAVEINQEIQNIFESNPLIEKEDLCEDHEEDNCLEHYSHYDQTYIFSDKNTVSTSEIIEKTASEEDTLQKYLMWQVEMLNISNVDKSLAETIIDYVNDDGYLIKNIFEIFDDVYAKSDVTVDELIAVQHLMQNLDPVGTCADGIKESLIIQLQNCDLESSIIQKSCIVINEFFKEYTEGKLKDIRENLQLRKEDIIIIDKAIKSQNPRPGTAVETKKSYDYIIPDIKVSKNNSNWTINSNKIISPVIKINEKYVKFSEENIPDLDKQYLKSNLQEAKSFIKNITYRNDTLLALSKFIFKKQINFFEGGSEKLLPMNLREAANDLGVHESTVSRLTTGKFMETPYGIFELKYFFSSSIINHAGEDFSSQSIKQKIKKIIKSEDKLKPFSDNKITKILAEEGIHLARRTVTKYRESLNLFSSSERKTK
tara:strand:+ start:3139 stop:4503 length:1365 start_codon:yes stop_codon:yes gene_type:complete